MANITNIKYISNYTGAQIDQAWNFIHTQIAEPFDNTKLYTTNDYVVHEGLLYQFKGNIAKRGDWDVNDWQVMKLFDNDGYWLFDSGRLFEIYQSGTYAVTMSSSTTAELNGTDLSLT